MGDEQMGIPEFFRGQNVFVTGATGFVGKVLIEKILRSCPDVGKIFVLTRPKKGVDMVQRWQEIKKLALFEVLNSKFPTAVDDKVVPVAGDVSELGLGLSEQDRELLIENVNIVYHAAASVKFDQPLKYAILMNTRSAREMCYLALEMKNIKMFMHISTAYCHTKNPVISEKMYPPYADWRKSIEIAENMDAHDLQIVLGHYTSGFPNTYTFTKSMSENVVNDLLENKVRNIIMRPSIVIPTHNDPIKGWVDNFYGPMGILTACGSGLVRVNFLNRNIVPDYMLVDVLIKAMLITTWINSKSVSLKTVVYNASSNGIHAINFGQFVDMAGELAWKYPLKNNVWYPSTYTTSNYYIYYVNVMLFHMIPALFLDGIIILAKHKPAIVKIQRKIYNAMMALKYFTSNEWTIRNETLYNAESLILPSDEKDFGYNIENFVVYNYFLEGMLGGKKWLLRESMDDLDMLKLRFKLMYVLDIIVKIMVYTLVFYLVFYKWDVMNCIGDRFEAYWSGLKV